MKTVLITGACINTGVAIVEKFASEGWRVIFTGVILSKEISAIFSTVSPREAEENTVLHFNFLIVRKKASSNVTS